MTHTPYIGTLTMICERDLQRQRDTLAELFKEHKITKKKYLSEAAKIRERSNLLRFYMEHYSDAFGQLLIDISTQTEKLQKATDNWEAFKNRADLLRMDITDRLSLFNRTFQINELEAKILLLKSLIK